MMDSMTLGATPVEEKCAELNVTPNYTEVAYAECIVYRRQLLRSYQEEFGTELPDACSLKVQPHYHDAGTYYEVSLRFNADFPHARRVASWFEENRLSHWDTTSRLELEELIPSPNG